MTCPTTQLACQKVAFHMHVHNLIVSLHLIKLGHCVRKAIDHYKLNIRYIYPLIIIVQQQHWIKFNGIITMPNAIVAERHLSLAPDLKLSWTRLLVACVSEL